VRPLPVKAEGVEKLLVDTLYDLRDGGYPSPESLGPASLGTIAFWRMDDPRSVTLEPSEVVLSPFKALVGDVVSRGGGTDARKSMV